MSTTASSRSRAARNGGIAFLTSAVVTGAAAVASGVAQADSTVPDDLFRSPWSADAFIVFCLVSAACHVLAVVGYVALRRAGVLGERPAVRTGLALAIGGTALLVLCEFASLAVADRAESSGAAGVVIGGYAIASVLGIGGTLVAGVASRHGSVWSGWQRQAVLAAGVLGLVVIALQPTSLLWLGVAVYGLGFAVIGAALLTAPAVHPAPRGVRVDPVV